MPRVSFFYGIAIYMYWNERDHSIPHFHAVQAEHRASVSVDGVVLAGELERRALDLDTQCPVFTGKSCSPPRSFPGTASRSSRSLPCRNMTVVTGTYLPVVVGAAVIRDHVLRLLFDDGTVGDVDFSAEEWRGVLKPLGDPKYFARIRVDSESGTVTWPNGEDLAPEPLYEQARAHPLVAA
jgi:hypothetical protein